jgi:hypothetical protein
MYFMRKLEAVLLDIYNAGLDMAYVFISYAALLVMIGSLRTFGSDKLQFWRECSSGINRLAFFLAKDTVDLSHVIIKPALYLSMFYFYNNPRSSFMEVYVVTLALVYCCSGIAYVLSIVLRPQPAQLVSKALQLQLI